MLLAYVNVRINLNQRKRILHYSLSFLDNQDTGLTPPHACVYIKPWHGFPTFYIVVFFSVQCVEVRGDCLFCWYYFHDVGMQVNSGIYHIKTIKNKNTTQYLLDTTKSKHIQTTIKTKLKSFLMWISKLTSQHETQKIYSIISSDKQ